MTDDNAKETKGIQQCMYGINEVYRETLKLLKPAIKI
jgi:hypothetical protein